MKLELEVHGLDVDDWLRDYMQTTVVFAIWHHESQIATARVRLDRSSHAVHCKVVVETADGALQAASASGADTSEAVQTACDRLEVALYRSGRPMGEERPLAA